MGLWTATFVTMILPKGKDYRHALETPPYAPWNVAIFLAALEMYVQTLFSNTRSAILTVWFFQQHGLRLLVGSRHARELPAAKYELRTCPKSYSNFLLTRAQVTPLPAGYGDRVGPWTPGEIEQGGESCSARRESPHLRGGASLAG